MRIVPVVVLAALVTLPFLVEASSATPAENQRAYVAGGSFGGTRYVCTSLDFDIGAACDVPCPGNTCSIDVMDAVRGPNIWFRICLEGQTFCEPQAYFGHAEVPGFHARVTVVPQLVEATTGVVVVR